MKQTESKTIAFLKEIGAKNVKSASQMKTELCRRYSREEAFEIHDRWVDVDQVSSIDLEDYDEIMSFFNASYERSIGAGTPSLFTSVPFMIRGMRFRVAFREGFG